MDEKIQPNKSRPGPQPGPCPECGGPRTVVVLKTAYEGTMVELMQTLRSTALFSGKSNTSQMNAATCTRCGHTTLYAIQPANLIPDREY